MNFFKNLFGKMGLFGKPGPESSSLRSYIENIEARVLEADSRVESCERAFYNSVSMISEYDGSSYSEALAHLDKLQDAVREREEALKELSGQMDKFRQVSGRRYRTRVYSQLYTSVYDELYKFKLF